MTTPRQLALVGGGGGLGTLARYGIAEAIPTQPGAWPLATLLVNLAGAAALGILLGVLARRGADDGSRRSLRLFWGAGFLGAFTTYSALAVEVDLLLRSGSVPTAAGYAAASMMGGVLAAAGGLWLAAPTVAGWLDVGRRSPADPDALGSDQANGVGP